MCQLLRHLTQKHLDITQRFRYHGNMMMKHRKPLVVAVIATNTVVGRAERRGSTRPVKPGIDPGMAAGLDFIASHYGDPFIGVRDVAAAMGRGRRQAERLFVPSGKTIREHIEEARLERACVLLRTTAMPLRAIAEECGFSSRPYLSLVFKKRFGKTPGEWRCRNTPHS